MTIVFLSILFFFHVERSLRCLVILGCQSYKTEIVIGSCVEKTGPVIDRPHCWGHQVCFFPGISINKMSVLRGLVFEALPFLRCCNTKCSTSPLFRSPSAITIISLGFTFLRSAKSDTSVFHFQNKKAQSHTNIVYLLLSPSFFSFVGLYHFYYFIVI